MVSKELTHANLTYFMRGWSTNQKASSLINAQWKVELLLGRNGHFPGLCIFFLCEKSSLSLNMKLEDSNKD